MYSVIRSHLDMAGSGIDSHADFNDVINLSYSKDIDTDLALYEQIEVNSWSLKNTNGGSFGSCLVHCRALQHSDQMVKTGIGHICSAYYIDVWSLYATHGQLDKISGGLVNLIPRLTELNANNVAFVNAMQLTKRGN